MGGLLAQLALLVCVCKAASELLNAFDWPEDVQVITKPTVIAMRCHLMRVIISRSSYRTMAARSASSSRASTELAFISSSWPMR